MSGGLDLSGLNDRQRQIAETLDVPIFVEAGAGSGKTFTLTQRVAWALSEGSGAGGGSFLEGLDQVLVITFTNAAAREIRERVRSTLRSAGMRDEALKVDRAWISTIHGMCERILRRHALDLGIDPGFSVCQGTQEADLRAQAVEGAVRAARDGGTCMELFSAYGMGYLGPTGASGVMGLVSDVISCASVLPGGLDALTPAPAPAGGVDRAVARLESLFEELASRELSEKAAAAVETTLSVLGDYKALGPDERRGPAGIQLLGGCKLPARSKVTGDLLPAARQALNLARVEAPFEQAASSAVALLDVARDAKRRYDELKRANSCLDNNDLIDLALAAVRDNAGIAAAYASRFKLVMVDEFQDTDTKQLELVRLLAGEGAAHLCTVGDAQQSIYRFRGADVGVFRSWGERFVERTPGGESVDRRIKLATNYRSHPDILAFVERVCKGRVAAGAGDGLAGQAGGCRGVLRDFMHLDADPNRTDTYRARGVPRVQVACVGGTGTSGRMTAAQRVALAEAMAERLAALRDAGERPGGMAVLLGVTTHTDLYIDAIRARGMECVVTGGSTFSQTQEARVMCALLHALANPLDTQSGLFPLLSSDMFALDADDFCALGTTVDEKTGALAKRGIDRGLDEMTFAQDEAPSRRLQAAHDVLARARRRLGSWSVADTCLWAVRESGWLTRLEGEGASGLARAANVLAAVRYVRDLTDELGLGPARAATEFDRWLEVAKEPPASLAGDEGDAVRVMTIHASKGLQFPVVAVAECWGARSSRSQMVTGAASAGDAGDTRPSSGRQAAMELIVSPRLSDAERRWLKAIEASSEIGEDSPLAERYVTHREQDRAEEAEEQARLLYVALTRAKEALVVGIDGACSKQGISSELAAGVLRTLVNVDEGLREGETAVDYGGSEPASFGYREVARGTGDAAAEETPERDTPPAAEDGLPPTEETPPAFKIFGVEPYPLADACPWSPREGVYSYSSTRDRVGEGKDDAPEDRAPSLGETGGDDATGLSSPDGSPVTQAPRERATSLGSAFHQLAQGMVETGRVPGEEQVDASVRLWGLSERTRGRLCQALERWEGSSVREEALSYDLVRAEVPFFEHLPSQFGTHVEGAIDLLCTNAAHDRALVVDYKTGDRTLSAEQIERRHAAQASLYARVLLGQGYGHVECAFVCVEVAAGDEPFVARYRFDR